MKAKIKLLSAMLIWGSIGLFVREIPLPSDVIALSRGITGCIFLMTIMILMKRKPSLTFIRQNLLLLTLSGICIGFNWILLFQSYCYTTIANTTLSYYMAPVFVILLSPVFLKERFSLKKAGYVLLAMIGLMFLLDFNGQSGSGYDHLKGILFGLGAAILYASAILMNRFVRSLDGLTVTTAQLGIATLVLLPYTMFTRFHPSNLIELQTKTIFLLLVIGIVHTGVAYYLYFSSIQKIRTETIAVFSYIDPISAIVLSLIVLGESMSLQKVIGAFLILGATFLNERSD